MRFRIRDRRAVRRQSHHASQYLSDTTRLTDAAFHSLPCGGPRVNHFDILCLFLIVRIDERSARIRDTINLVIREYGDHPCVVPNCPCMVHRIGLPQADEIASMLERIKEANAAVRR